MLLFIGDATHKDLSEKIAEGLGVQCFYPDIHVFPDSEKRVRVLEDVVEKDVILFKSLTSPVDGNVIETCLLIDALKRSGAKSIHAVVPYFPYQRADHVFRIGEAVPLEVVIKMVESSGLDRILIAEPHSIKIPEMFIIPVSDVSAVSLFAEKIKELSPDMAKISVVSPDMGGIRRIKLLSEALDNCSYVAVNKDRDLETGDSVATKHEGDIKEVCFIFDDMISTGGTVVDACEYLIEHGAREVYIMATHPVFSGDAVSLLKSSNAKRVFVTDAIAVPEEKRFEKLEILPIAPLIAQKVKEAF